ncbi:cytochrome c3 family protein [Candidatus Sulfurimonas baltica]|uniref:Cytochrome C n=1 Tax=Candidatus Sulfurimonas baltica TaxID=2740404 RepID=A0A7S7RMY3_9BACT|nr:cytochrome c3 family protein [Candidatus Sulfurimonas baltica]QOY51868.1 cytochrome C [Candidatus Sulfurimonas baltica]
MKLIKLFIFGVTFFTSITLFAGIVNTKHNLSVTNNVVDGNNTIVKATVETQICVFCHTPHEADTVAAPLWNRSMPVSAYTMYDSDYLKRTGYPTPTELGSAAGEPGTISRQCLSCHDGTVAIGAISNAPGSGKGDGSDIAMSGVAGDGTMQSTSSAFIGTDLSNHHPVAISYGEPMTMPVPGVDHNSSSSRGNELVTDPEANSSIVLRTYPAHDGKKFVECISCHDPHKENEKFLRVDVGTHAQNIAATCQSCHIKDNFEGSTHDVMNATYSNTAVNDKFSAGAATKVSDMKCANCHTPHNSGSEYLTRQVQEQTCFQGASDTVSTAPCHGTNHETGGKDIETVMTRTYGHGPTLLNIAGNTNHTNLDYVYGEGTTNDRGPTSGIDWATSEHVECMDCHNQHQVQKISRKPATQTAGKWYPDTPGADTNKIVSASYTTSPLKGASGVKPSSWPGRWLQPVEFTTLETATYEYEICFKCHSYWGMGADNDNGDTLVDSPAHSAYLTRSDGSVQFTDVAWEFNPNNRSGHPVNVALNDRTGSYAPKAYTASQMKDPWKTNVGDQTMYCSDCHGADNEPETDPKGPHGSSYKFMLKGVGKFWPANSDGTLYRQPATTGTGDLDILCKNCHETGAAGVGHTDQDKSEMSNSPCVRCHVAIPHGSPVSRLFVYATFPAPYNYGGNTAGPVRFRKPASGTAGFGDVRTVGGCSGKHDGLSSGGDSAPLNW